MGPTISKKHLFKMRHPLERILYRLRKGRVSFLCLVLLAMTTALLVLVSLSIQKQTGMALDEAMRFKSEASRPTYIEIETTKHLQKMGMVKKHTKKEHVILIYTKMWGRKVWSFFDKIENYKDRHGNKCPVQNCVVAYEKNVFHKASAVVFHGHGNDAVSQLELKLLSRERKPNQIWVYFTHSPPHINTPHSSFFNGFYNWTMTYQKNSDIVIPYSWELGTWEKRSKLDVPPTFVDYAKGKDSLLYADINSCGLLRDKFIMKLQKYVSIDVYGSCSKNFHKNVKMMPKNSRKQSDLKKRYKFYLAAEKDFCSDFMSQRFYQVLFNGNAVPIVLGGANYSRSAIPMSFIDALSFNTVKELGDYINFLDKNDDEYRKYQSWRQYYILGPPLSWTCEMCKKLNSENFTPKVYSNLGDWYNEKNCGKGIDVLRRLLERSGVGI